MRMLSQGYTHEDIASLLGLHLKAIQRLVRKLHERLDP
jgi:hypothetical protein